MRFGRRPILGPLVAATLVLAACGGDDDDSGSDSEPAPTTGAGAEPEPEADAAESSGGDSGATAGNISCSLITRADLEAAGLTVEGGPTADDGPFDQCLHDLLGSTGIPGPFSTRALTADQHGGLAPEAYNDWEDVPGIADEAWYIDTLNLAEARFANGLQISVQEVPGDLTRDELLALLSLAVSRV